MGKFDWIKAAFRSNPIDQTTAPTEPIAIAPSSIIGGRLQEQKDFRDARDRYSLADNLVNSDERLFSAPVSDPRYIKFIAGQEPCNLFVETFRHCEPDIRSRREHSGYHDPIYCFRGISERHVRTYRAHVRQVIPNVRALFAV